ncbi:MAG: SMI1/KNR4 family protein [Angelakisella sp.]|nr:SMI1/KNR4 family protein [Angelakisella sp.]
MTPFEGFDLSDFWEEPGDCARKNYIEPPPTAEVIRQVEKELGYKLPESYIALMQVQNGGFSKKAAFPTSTPTSWADDHIAIEGFLSIGWDKTYSLCGRMGSRFMIEEWGYPDIGIAICDCPSAGHDMVFLDYRECGPQGEPKVVHIDQEDDYYITPLADSFEAFIRGLVDEEDYWDNEDDEEQEEE